MKFLPVFAILMIANAGYAQRIQLPDLKEMKNLKEACENSAPKDIKFVTRNTYRQTYTTPQLQAIMDERHESYVKESSNILDTLKTKYSNAPEIPLKQKLQICQMKEELLGRSSLRESEFAEYFGDGRMSAILELNHIEMALTLLHAFEIAYVHRKDDVAADILNLLNIANPEIALYLREVVSMTGNKCLLDNFPAFKKPSDTEYVRSGLGSRYLTARKILADGVEGVTASERAGLCDVTGLRKGLFGFSVPLDFADAKYAIFPQPVSALCSNASDLIADGKIPVLRSERHLNNAAAYRSCTTLGGGCHGWSPQAVWQARQKIRNETEGSVLGVDVGRVGAGLGESLKAIFNGTKAGEDAAYRAGIAPDILVTNRPDEVHPRPSSSSEQEKRKPTERYDAVLRQAEECTITEEDMKAMRREASMEFSQELDSELELNIPAFNSDSPHYDNQDPRSTLIDIPVVNGNLPEYIPKIPSFSSGRDGLQNVKPTIVPE